MECLGECAGQTDLQQGLHVLDELEGVVVVAVGARRVVPKHDLPLGARFQQLLLQLGQLALPALFLQTS